MKLVFANFYKLGPFESSRNQSNIDFVIVTQQLIRLIVSVYILDVWQQYLFIDAFLLFLKLSTN